MPDQVFPQHGDEPDAANFAQLLGQANISDYVESGFAFTVDYGALTLDIGAGKAYIAAPTMDTASGDIDPPETRVDVAYVVETEARNGIALTDAAVNHIYLDANVGVDDSPKIVVKTDEVAPSDKSLKLGEVDTANDTSTETHRQPRVNVRELVDGADVSHSGELADVDDLHERYTNEEARDAIAAALSAAGNISLSVDDNGETITVDTSALNSEEVEDTVAELITADSNLTVSYDDENDALNVGLSSSVEADSVTVNNRLSVPTYPTKSEIPEDLPEGSLAYTEDEDTLYLENGQ